MTIRRRLVTLGLTAYCLLPSSAQVPVGAQTTPPAKTPAPAKPQTAPPPPKAPAPPPPAAKAPAATPAGPADVDGGWPRDSVTAAGGALRVFQPQIASWDGQKKMVAFAAVSYTPKDATKPALGTVQIEAETSVAVEDRLVNFTSAKLTESHFADLPKEGVRDVVESIEKMVPQNSLVIGLDRVLARLDKSQIIPKNVVGLKADPPVIMYSTSPAVLVNIDGDPVWSPIKENDLKYAVNTNWDLFEHEPTKTFYLRKDQSWLTAKAATGPWTAAGTLPGSFSKLPPDDNWKDVKAALPGKPLTAAPKVFVSTKPAELILLTGAPIYVPVTGTKLLWLSNTEADVFRMGSTGPVYYLVSGRWFSASGYEGPWTFTTPTLPEDFKKIPREHPRSRVLASVPGTDEAVEAVLLAQVPQTARVSKKQIQAPEVTYDTEPQFERIGQTTMSRAVNTDKDIIKVGDLYYMCFQGVWFMGKSPTGPWEVTGSVPGQIYEIPVSSPSYPVTQVTVVEDNSDEVAFATAAAYTGLMIGWGCAVWGTGYYYPPYVYYGGYYPMYRPYYPTYGYYASYNPWTGTYGRGMVAYGPYGGAGVGARYNPRTGTYARGAAAWGPYGARGVAGAYNPRTGTSAGTRQGSGVYGSWGQTAVRRGDQWATSSRVTNRVTDTTTRVTRGSEGGGAITRNGPGGNNSGLARTSSGDIYAGRDGNVYRKQDGNWQKYDGGGNWSGVQPTDAQRQQAQDRANDARARAGSDSSTVGQLNRDSSARAEGAQRTRDYSSSSGARSGSGSSSSYRPRSSSGAGRSMPRGGGGRRR